MAVERYKSNIILAKEDETIRLRPTSDHGKKRVQFFEVPALTVAGDALSTFDLCVLPPGAVRILLLESKVRVSAWGASRLLDIGHRAYSHRPPDNADEVEDLDALAVGIDVATAGIKDFAGVTQLKFDLYSRTGVMVSAQVRGGTAPVAATLQGYITYIYE